MGFPRWPIRALAPRGGGHRPAPVTRIAGATLGGQRFGYRTDAGFWRCRYDDVILETPKQRRLLRTMREQVRGVAGLIIVPAVYSDENPWPLAASGAFAAPLGPVPHAGGVGFVGAAGYRRRTILLEVAEPAAVGDGVVKLREKRAGPQGLEGIWFSYRWAMYETGGRLSLVSGVWELPVFPAVRRAIPAGVIVEADRPECLMHPASDAEFDAPQDAYRIARLAPEFEEATDWFAEKAAEDAA